MPDAPAPNRVLALDDLGRDEFRSVLARLDVMTAMEDVSHLHPSKRWEYPWAVQRAAAAGILPGSRVLDAGCGASIFPVFLADMGYDVMACDLEVPLGPPRLDSLHGVRVDYRQADVTAVPAPDAALDAVFCISVIEHLPRQAMTAALREFHRLLRPGGRLLLTTDYARDAAEPMVYTGPGPSFAVDWNVFDEAGFTEVILKAQGFVTDGEVDLTVDWEAVRPAMTEFHGYPYTAVGVCLRPTS